LHNIHNYSKPGYISVVTCTIEYVSFDYMVEFVVENRADWLCSPPQSTLNEESCGPLQQSFPSG